MRSENGEPIEVEISYGPSGPTPTSLTATADSKMSIGIDSAGHVYVNIDGEVEKFVHFTIAAPLTVLVTGYTMGSGTPASVKVVYDSDEFTNTYPAVSGITKHTDFCGNEL